ncbi:hypothetical protein PANT_7c00074 [Moesziomyces antarcticus T-34]|uniref:RlpA-like protein double-psi beta-barrel domain-containing protein n=1 Tax=Pseudozyma antarctica (strain T-34) TaxID=1151754 RepID=M9LLI1_PSEA3|nr:hypothetical protein PANT_7c00074 [Moesziomyces antarcticus T-34]
MIYARTLLLALVAVSLMTVVQATQSISHNAAVRRHASMVSQRPARRSLDVSAGRMVHKRQTAEQIKQAADLKAWDDDFHKKNAEWQQAAMAALASGQTPPSYDEYWSGKSASSAAASANADSSASSGSNGQSSTPAQQQQQQQQSADNTNADSSNNDTSDSTECEEDSADTSDNASSGAAAAAASGSKSNAAKGNGGGSSSSSSSNSSSNSSSSSNSGSSSSSSSSSSESTSGSFDGQATYYAPGLGACGWTNTESDYIVAVSHSLFDSFGTGNPNKNPICGHKIKATYQGKSITVSVSDRCEGCAWGDLDFTPSGFQQLAPLSKGRLDGLTWSWIGSAP